MQFVVPQFIDVESKVIGPISVRQFIILLFTGGLIFLEFELFTFWVFAILGLFTLAVGGIFAFLKVNSQPFHIFALSLLQTVRRPNLAVWNRKYHLEKIIKTTKKTTSSISRTKSEVSSSDLAELSLIVDTGGRYTPEDLERLRQQEQVQQTISQKSKNNRTQQ